MFSKTKKEDGPPISDVVLKLTYKVYCSKGLLTRKRVLRRADSDCSERKSLTGILSMEVASIMRGAVEIWNVLSAPSLDHLRKELENRAIVIFVCHDKNKLWNLAGLEVMEQLESLAKRLSVVGLKCTEPRLTALRHLFEGMNRRNRVYEGFRLSKEEIDALLGFMNEQVQKVEELKLLMGKLQTARSTPAATVLRNGPRKSMMEELDDLDSTPDDELDGEDEGADDDMVPAASPSSLVGQQAFEMMSRLIDLQQACMWSLDLDTVVRALVLFILVVRERILVTFPDANDFNQSLVPDNVLGNAALSFRYGKLIELMEKFVNYPFMATAAKSRAELYELLPNQLRCLLKDRFREVHKIRLQKKALGEKQQKEKDRRRAERKHAKKIAKEAERAASQAAEGVRKEQDEEGKVGMDADARSGTGDHGKLGHQDTSDSDSDFGSDDDDTHGEEEEEAEREMEQQLEEKEPGAEEKLQWAMAMLPPLAQNTIKRDRAYSFRKTKKERYIWKVQTLYYAQKNEVDMTIVDILMGLNLMVLTDEKNVSAIRSRKKAALHAVRPKAVAPKRLTQMILPPQSPRHGQPSPSRVSPSASAALASLMADLEEASAENPNSGCNISSSGSNSGGGGSGNVSPSMLPPASPRGKPWITVPASNIFKLQRQSSKESNFFSTALPSPSPGSSSRNPKESPGKKLDLLAGVGERLLKGDRTEGGLLRAESGKENGSRRRTWQVSRSADSSPSRTRGAAEKKEKSGACELLLKDLEDAMKVLEQEQRESSQWDEWDKKLAEKLKVPSKPSKKSPGQEKVPSDMGGEAKGLWKAKDSTGKVAHGPRKGFGKIIVPKRANGQVAATTDKLAIMDKLKERKAEGKLGSLEADLAAASANEPIDDGSVFVSQDKPIMVWRDVKTKNLQRTSSGPMEHGGMLQKASRGRREHLAETVGS